VYLLFAILSGHLGPAPELPEGEILALVRRARGGDTEAMAALYTAHVHRVFRAVRALCRSEAEAEDVVQDAFIKAFASLGSYEARPNRRFLAWLSTIALNAARNRLTRGARRRELAREDAARDVKEAPATPEEQMLRAEARGRLLEALGGLSTRDREVVSLRYGAGLEAAEVAELCGLSAANVRKICERQRRRLLAALSIDASEAPTEGASP
jgi:RNA polymerase sigma-70 factor (ECF subfamily)